MPERKGRDWCLAPTPVRDCMVGGEGGHRQLQAARCPSACRPRRDCAQKLQCKRVGVAPGVQHVQSQGVHTRTHTTISHHQTCTCTRTQRDIMGTCVNLTEQQPKQPSTAAAPRVECAARTA